MDKQPTVVFRNVGQLYFPQTRVECHYSLTSEHRWSSSDWIGIFEVGCSSVKQYHTYTWALAPEGYTEGTNVNCCALFHAFYLPRPSSVEYQFLYVDKNGKKCASSRPFTFCAPKPLEELETLREEREEEDGEEELLLVIPRAQLLQSQLDECLKKQADLQQALDDTNKKKEKEKENNKVSWMERELEREAMRGEITELRDNLRYYSDMLKKIEGKHKDVKYSQENLSYELSVLLAEKAESQQRIRDLEEDKKILTDREKEGNMEMERKVLKERVKKMSSQMKHDEEKRKSLQEENEAALMEARGLQDRLDAAEYAAEGLRRELRELGTRQGHANTELHQARLQVAQLTLQLSEENLLLREERATCALEREANRHAAEADMKKLQELSCEVQRKEEWLQEERTEREKLEAELGRERDCNRVLLSEAKQELQELKASLRRAQREKEEQQLEKQDLLNYIRELELRLEIVPENKSKGETSSSPDSSSEDQQEVSSAPARSVCSPVFLSTDLEEPDRAETLTKTQNQSKESTAAFDTQDTMKQQCDAPANERKELILPELINPILSVLADAPMW